MIQPDWVVQVATSMTAQAELPPDWTIQVMTLMVFILVFMVLIFRMRTKYQKQAIENVQCKFITEQGTSYKKLLRVVRGFVTLEGNKKLNKGAKDFPVADVATYQIEYPEGWVPRFLRTTIREMIFREDTWEPQYNRGNPLLNPETLYNIKNERFTEMGLVHSQREAELEKKIQEKLKPSTVYILLGVVVVAVVAIGFIVFQRFGEMGEILEKLARALGV